MIDRWQRMLSGVDSRTRLYFYWLRRPVHFENEDDGSASSVAALGRRKRQAFLEKRVQSVSAYVAWAHDPGLSAVTTQKSSGPWWMAYAKNWMARRRNQQNSVYLHSSIEEAAAKAFFRKALKHHQEPHSITLDGHQPSHSALRRMGMNGEFNFRGRNPVKIRCCQYLNNVVEQDHRRVKGRLRPMLGFKTFYNARRVIIGIELAQKIHKRQFAIPITLQSNPAVTWRHVMAG